jgi:magnesium-transporting ATPase (P-type)
MLFESQIFTGESEPLDCTAAEAATYVSAMDAHNIAFNSSMVLEGEAYGIVIRTGDNTFIGRAFSVNEFGDLQNEFLIGRQSGETYKRTIARSVEHVVGDQSFRQVHRDSIAHDGDNRVWHRCGGE